jgi:hypothetical protein
MTWLQTNAALISLITTIVLVIITAVYVYLTKKILDTSVRQSNLIPNPVIGIRLGNIKVGAVYGPSRRSLSVKLNLINIGNAPGIELLVDGEFVLHYTDINGEKQIPARFEPRFISYLRPGEEMLEVSSPSLSFGNNCIKYLFADFRECKRLNMKRIETDPTRRPYKSSIIKIYVYYRNNLGQYFESTYMTHLKLEELPEDNQSIEIKQIYFPNPEFHSAPTAKKLINKNISYRNTKRYLSGW